MTHFAAIILGLVEGLTEFIPVSSSGHLLIAHKLLGQNLIGTLSFDAIIQLATSCALLVYFWRDILQIIKTAWFFVCRRPIEPKDRTLLYAIFFGTLPAVFLGLLLEKSMDTIFRNISLVALTLLFGSLLLWYGQKKYFSNYQKTEDINSRQPQGFLSEKVLTVKHGVIIGFYQCLALLPGVSRSGATISGGLISGLSQEEATRFSFLLSIPILFGAGLKKVFEVRSELFSANFISPIILGSLVAFISGLFSISFLMKYLKTHNLNVFIWYRVVLAIVLFLVF
jgi:undecaprenyl-diphosphatase